MTTTCEQLCPHGEPIEMICDRCAELETIDLCAPDTLYVMHVCAGEEVVRGGAGGQTFGVQSVNEPKTIEQRSASQRGESGMNEGASNEHPDASSEGVAVWAAEYKAGVPQARERLFTELYDCLSAGGSAGRVVGAIEGLIEAKLREFK